MSGSAGRQAGYERRFIAAIAAYVFLLQALIVGFVPIPTSAERDLAASAYDLCHHPGQPAHRPAGQNDPCSLVGFFDYCCAIGHGGLSPSPAALGLAPPLPAGTIAFRPRATARRSLRPTLAAQPRGPPVLV